MKKNTSLLLLCFLAVSLAGATPIDTSKVRLKPYGFIRNYLNVDSRNTSTVCGGEYLLVPLDEDWNITQEAASQVNSSSLPEGMDVRFDKNAVPQARFQALSSRVGVALTGPALLGAAVSGKFEGDFAGFGTSNTVLRLRLAFLRLDWYGDRCRQTVVVGQDWHPLGGDIMPEVIGMSAGGPFRPHSRTPQLRYEWQHGSMLLMAASLFQYQFTSPGPEGESATYANQSLFPEFFAGVGYRGKHLYSQLGIDYNRLMVSLSMNSLSSVDSEPLVMRFKASCHAFSPTFYLQYVERRFSLKLRSTLAQNLGHLTMLSGYALVTDKDDATKIYYRPMRSSVTYLDLAYGKKWCLNLFTGYQFNFGLGEDYSIEGDHLFMKKGIRNIRNIYRIAPSISYNTKAINIGLEYELTAASYGKLQSDGSVSNDADLHMVVNNRLCLMVKYNW